MLAEVENDDLDHESAVLAACAAAEASLKESNPEYTDKAIKTVTSSIGNYIDLSSDKHCAVCLASHSKWTKLDDTNRIVCSVCKAYRNHGAENAEPEEAACIDPHCLRCLDTCTKRKTPPTPATAAADSATTTSKKPKLGTDTDTDTDTNNEADENMSNE